MKMLHRFLWLVLAGILLASAMACNRSNAIGADD